MCIRDSYRTVCGTIHRCLKNKTWKDTRRKFYKTVAVPTFLYASETWTLGKRDVRRIQAAEMKSLRGTQGCSLLDRKRNEDIRRELNNVSLHQRLKTREGDVVITWTAYLYPSTRGSFGLSPYWEEICRLTEEETVSYTHLDVYKRQVRPFYREPLSH